jgi:hypothetical protein
MVDTISVKNQEADRGTQHLVKMVKWFYLLQELDGSFNRFSFS